MSTEIKFDAFTNHRGSSADYLLDYRRLVEQLPGLEPCQQEQFAATLLDRIADFKNLRAARQHLSAKGGRAPGPNGMTLDRIPRDQAWALLKSIREQIVNGEYYPGPEGRRRIPKGNGATRELCLTNIENRIVERGLVQILQPLVDPKFGDWVFGGRPRQSPWRALATAEVFAKEGRTTWICDDIKTAFDQVPLRRLIEVLPKYGIPESVVTLISRIIERPSGKGLRQGGPLSSLLLNVFLDHFLDYPWSRKGSGALIRFVDDLLVPLPGTAHSSEAYAELSRVLRNNGMRLKGTSQTAIIDLAQGEKATWLGFEISIGESGLQFDLPLEFSASGKLPHWAESLESALRRCHKHPDPVHRAKSVLNGVLRYAAPFYATAPQDRFYKQVYAIAHAAAFDEIPSRDELLDCWKAYHDAWQSLRHGVQLDYAARHAPRAPFEVDARIADLNPAGEDEVQLYTDGCRLENGAGGWAFIIERPGTRRVIHMGGLRRPTSIGLS